MADIPLKAEIVQATRQDELGSNWVDALVAALKGTAGAVPAVGGLAGELLGATIPRQRLDRIVDTLRRLGQRVDALEADLPAVKDRLRSAEFLPVFEETIQQASRAYSEERRQHLANLLAKGIADSDLDRARQLTVLEILRELSDEEIVLLAWRAHLPGRAATKAFSERHHHILHPPVRVIGGPQENRIADGVHTHRLNKLVQMGLLKPDVPGPNGVTTLGRIVLVFIDADVGNEIPL